MTAIIGGDLKRETVGWEAIKPKPSTKPLFVRMAEEKLEEAWQDYYALVETLYPEDLSQVKQGAQAALEDAYDRIEIAQLEQDTAYKSWHDGLDTLEIPF